MNTSDEMYLELKAILEKQNNTKYTIEDVKEIGNDLVELFILLMDDDMRKDLVLDDESDGCSDVDKDKL